MLRNFTTELEQLSSLSNLELGMKPAWDLSILVTTTALIIGWIREGGRKYLNLRPPTLSMRGWFDWR